MAGTNPIVDSYGRPIRVDDFFQSGSPRFRESQPRRAYDSARDTWHLLSNASWRQLLSAGRFLFANSPIIRGALLEQALYSFPVEARYRGSDKKWGELAEEWLWSWKQNPTFAGPQVDASVISRIRMIGYKTDGDIFTALTFDENGFPKQQIIRAHRISSGWYEYPNGILTEGPWNGNRIINGVVFDTYGRKIGYKLCAPDWMNGTEEEARWIPADSIIQTFRPDYSDEFRGISHLSASIASFTDIKRLHEYELKAMAIQSAISISEKNEAGAPDDLAQRLFAQKRGITDSTDPLTIQEYDSGTTKYFKSNTGSGLEFHTPERPGENWQAFFDRVVRLALYGMEWEPDFALAIKEPKGAWARTILEKVNRVTKMNFDTEVRTVRMVDFYAINKAISLGVLPMPSDGDTTAWEYAMGIPRITADFGNEQDAKREAYKLGTATLHDLSVERGMDWEETREQREAETRDLLTRAQGLSRDYGITIQEALALLEQRSPNPPQLLPNQGQRAE